MRVIFLAILLAGSSLVGMISAEAHPGRSCGLVGLRLEGECYTSVSPPPTCDPNSLGAHVEIVARADASGGEVARLPNAPCYLPFSAPFPFAVVPDSVRLGVTATSPGSHVAKLYYRVGSLQTYAGDARIFASRLDPLKTAVVTETVEIPPGAEGFVLRYELGPYGSNLLVDAVDFTRSCNNRAPVIAALTSDGLDGGSAGWTGSSYRFEAAAADPDGDPIARYEWDWGDGTTSVTTSAAATHVYATRGERIVSVVAVDAPTPALPASCPSASARSAARASSFEAIEFVAVEVVEMSWVGVRPCAVGACALVVDRDQVVGATVTEGYEHFYVSYRLDGVEHARGSYALSMDDRGLFRGFVPFSTALPGPHTFEACAVADDDVYERIQCSPIWAVVTA